MRLLLRLLNGVLLLGLLQALLVVPDVLRYLSEAELLGVVGGRVGPAGEGEEEAQGRWAL